MAAGRGKFYETLGQELRAFAERHFALGSTDKDGVSWRETLEGLLARTRRPDKRTEYEAQLECPPFPMPLLHVWKAFQRLSSRRGSNGFAINPITWPDIDAFVRHSRVSLAPWEVRLIEEIDDLFRIEQAKPKD